MDAKLEYGTHECLCCRLLTADCCCCCYFCTVSCAFLFAFVIIKATSTHCMVCMLFSSFFLPILSLLLLHPSVLHSLFVIIFVKYIFKWWSILVPRNFMLLFFVQAVSSSSIASQRCTANHLKMRVIR